MNYGVSLGTYLKKSGIYSVAMFHMNEPRFSNCFIEKRGSSYVESLVVRDFPLFVAPDLFFKILQMQKQYFYVGQRFRRYFPKSNKHYSLLVSCNLYKLILQ